MLVAEAVAPDLVGQQVTISTWLDSDMTATIVGRSSRHHDWLIAIEDVPDVVYLLGEVGVMAPAGQQGKVAHE